MENYQSNDIEKWAEFDLQQAAKKKKSGHILLLSSLLLFHSVCASAYVVHFLLSFWSGKSFLDPFKIEFKIFFFFAIYRINAFGVLCHQKYEVWLKVY